MDQMPCAEVKQGKAKILQSIIVVVSFNVVLKKHYFLSNITVFAFPIIYFHLKVGFGAFKTLWAMIKGAE